MSFQKPTTKQVEQQIRPRRPSLKQIIRRKLEADPTTIRDAETMHRKFGINPRTRNT